MGWCQGRDETIDDRIKKCHKCQCYIHEKQDGTFYPCECYDETKNMFEIMTSKEEINE